MDPNFPPTVILTQPLPVQEASPLMGPVQHVGELSLTMPLSADMDLVRHVAGFALEPQVYNAVFGFSVVAIGIAIAINARPPSFADVCKALTDAMLLAAALTVISMISPLPIGYAILFPGVLVTVGAAMFLVALLFQGCDLAAEWFARRVTAKPALHRRHLAFRICLLFTRQWFRSGVAVVGICLLGAALVYRFAPFLPLGIPMVAARLVPRNIWRRLARNAFRTEAACRSTRRIFAHPLKP